MEDRHLALSEVAGLMGVSERTVRRWIKSGKLRAYKPGRDYRIPESAVREFVEKSEISPKGRRSSLEPSLFNGLEDEQRKSVYEIALTAARQQAEQDRQAAARAIESERPQTYFMRHENDAVPRLLRHPADELAGALVEMARRLVQLEEATAAADTPLSLEDFPIEQVAAFLAEDERDKERLKRELEKLTPRDIKEMMLANPPLRRISKAYAETEKRRVQDRSEVS